MPRSTLVRCAALATLASAAIWGCSSKVREFGHGSGGRGGDAGNSVGMAGEGGISNSPCSDPRVSAGACAEDGGASAGESGATSSAGAAEGGDAGASTGETSGTSNGGTSNGGASNGGTTNAGGSNGGSSGSVACTLGSEGCACNSGGVCSGSLVCRGAKCAKVVCGDSRIEGVEVCDDGNNYGSAVGDCASDCSVIVVQKQIVQSAAGVPANFAKNGAGSTPQTADSYCPSGYKALFADGFYRIASVHANQGDGQSQWVLRTWTRYVNASAQLIWLTQNVRLLGVSNGQFVGLKNPIVPGSNSGYLTGMSGNWLALASGRNCSAWASVTSAAQGMIGIGGSITSTFLEQAADFTYPCSDVTSWRLYCVEQ